MSCQFELVHIGLNTKDEAEAQKTAETLALLFNLNVRKGNKSIFGGDYFECMKAPYLGTHGHIAMRTQDLPGAMEELAEKGFSFNMDTAAYDPEGRMTNVYLEGEFAGFAIHIMQKK